MEIVGVPSTVNAPYIHGVSPTSSGSTQDIPIQLIIDMDNSFELNPQTYPLQDPPPKDPTPFIEVKPKNRRRNPPIGQITPSPGEVLTRNRQRVDYGSDSRGMGRPNAVSKDR